MPDTVHLKRSLKLWHLIVYGIIIIQPVAPMGIYGTVYNVAHGHVALTLLVAMVAMLFTAVSYGRMARVYPEAGSAYIYVSKEVNPHLGYIVGWSMLMDYMLNPVLCVILCSQLTRNILPSVPYFAWVLAYGLVITFFNTRGVQTSGRVNAILAGAMGLAVVLFFAEGITYLLRVMHPSHAELLKPFFDAPNFRMGAIFQGTSIAVLSYIGFDGISTMAEEVENPRRNILLATVFTCLFMGCISMGQVYLAQMAQPYHGPFPESTVDSAFVFAAQIFGGRVLFHIINTTLLVANFGSGIAAMYGASRLMYSMGRNRSLPPRLFGALNPRTQVPLYNVLILGVIAIGASFFLSYGQGAELLNFGAFIAFIGVNAAALLHCHRTGRHEDKNLGSILFSYASPIAGILICTFIWIHLSRNSQILGTIWIVVGLITMGFMRRNGGGRLS